MSFFSSFSQNDSIQFKFEKIGDSVVCNELNFEKAKSIYHSQQAMLSFTKLGVENGDSVCIVIHDIMNLSFEKASGKYGTDEIYSIIRSFEKSNELFLDFIELDKSFNSSKVEKILKYVDSIEAESKKLQIELDALMKEFNAKEIKRIDDSIPSFSSVYPERIIIERDSTDIYNFLEFIKLKLVRDSNDVYSLYNPLNQAISIGDFILNNDNEWVFIYHPDKFDPNNISYIENGEIVDIYSIKYDEDGLIHSIIKLSKKELFNRAEFLFSLEIIRKEEMCFGVMNVEQYRKSVLYVSRITGHFSRADISSTLGYVNHKDYEFDMKKWKNWYKSKTGKRVRLKDCEER